MADLDKVKRNIKRMIDADAPDADIDAYLADEGVSQNELQAPAKAAEPDVMTKLHDPNTLLGKPLQFMDDLTNVSGDAVTRGFGENDTTDAAVQASRERLGWGALPVDVVSSVVSSPYKIGSMGAGALFGGLEGAASAYGHQQGWVPGWDVLKGAGEGAAFGAGGAKLGEWAGRGWNRMFGETPPAEPSYGRTRPAPTPMEPPPVPQVGRIGSAIQSYGSIPRAVSMPIDAGLFHIGVPPFVTGSSAIAEQAGKLFKPQLPPAARPPEPAAAAAARDAMARMMIGYGRSP